MKVFWKADEVNTLLLNAQVATSSVKSAEESLICAILHLNGSLIETFEET